LPIQGSTLPVIELTFGGNDNAVSMTVLAVLRLQLVDEETETVSLTKPAKIFTTTAVSLAPKAFKCDMVAFVPIFNVQT
jgi:hypothetical protein